MAADPQPRLPNLAQLRLLGRKQHAEYVQQVKDNCVIQRRKFEPKRCRGMLPIPEEFNLAGKPEALAHYSTCFCHSIHCYSCSLALVVSQH